MSTQKTKKAVNRVVYWTVWRAVQWIVDAALGRAVNGAVWGAVEGVVHDAVSRDEAGAMWQDPAHPAIQDFLREVEA